MAHDWNERAEDFESRPTRETIKWTARGWVVAVVVIGLALVLGAGIWALKVATSDVKGVGDAEILKNEAKNRIQAQEGFWKRYEAIKAADRNLSLTAETLKSKPDDLKLQTELLGQQMVCNDLVGQYNASAQKFTEREFRDAELPHQIDDTSPDEIDCKENGK